MTDFEPTLSSDEAIRVHAWLAGNGYPTVEDWALDSDYLHLPGTLIWTDEDGNRVNIEVQAFHAMEAEAEAIASQHPDDPGHPTNGWAG